MKEVSDATRQQPMVQVLLSPPPVAARLSGHVLSSFVIRVYRIQIRKRTQHCSPKNSVKPDCRDLCACSVSIAAPVISRTATPALVRLVLSAVRREHRLPCQFPLTQHVHLTGELATRQYNRPLISIFSRRSSAIESHASQAQGLVRACVVRPLFVYPSGFPQPRGPPGTQLPGSVCLTAFRVIESVWAWSQGRSCPGLRARTFVDG